jgi:FAD/FMN-containing dehydrogenase
VKFVPKAGGHSLYSTIGADGVIVDLTALNAVVIDKEAGTVTISGGSQIKDALAPLFEAGFCAPFGMGNTVGAVSQGLYPCGTSIHIV